jgi:predicted RNA-binding Zn-ribbon protein involved in translation (DUF1610 family)
MSQIRAIAVAKSNDHIAESNESVRELVMCPACGGEAVARQLRTGRIGKACRHCGWWRFETPDGEVEAESPRFNDDTGA